VENSFNFKSIVKDVQLTEIAEAEAILSCTDQIQLEKIPIIGEIIEILLLHVDFHVNRKYKSTTM
jgi:hypothetical protein